MSTRDASPQPVEDHPGKSIQKMAVLFTDLAGSSEFFESPGDLAGRKMLRRHQDIASAAVNEHGGVLVKIQGDSAMAYFFNAKKALKCAIRIQQGLGKYNRKTDPQNQIRIRIGIHFGDGIVEENDVFGNVVNIAAKLIAVVDVDQIYISQEVHNLVHDLSQVRFELVDLSGKKDAPTGLTIYRTIWEEAVKVDPAQKDHETSSPHLFLYHDALTKGKNPPCFYCGDKRHLAVACPSKGLPEMTRALNDMGYLSFDKINSIFLDYVAEGRLGPKLDEEHKTGTDRASRLAYYAYYDLKRVFQLRFFRNVWNVHEDDWYKIKETSVTTEEKGGDIWIGTDCLRVSKLAQAEVSLETSIERHPRDYRPYCALGFLNVEKNDFLTAQYYFVKALDYTKTRPQKILVLLLLSRLYDLENHPFEAAEKIGEILRTDSRCAEAMYQDIVFKLREHESPQAIGRLIKLIQLDRQFFVNALIDPELAPFSKTIPPVLKGLFEEAKNEALQTRDKAETEFNKLKELLGEEEIKEARSLKSNIEELSRTDGYFTYLDLIHYGKSLINISRRSLEKQRTNLAEILYGLRGRTKKCLVFVGEYPYPSLVGTAYQKLKLVGTKISQTQKMASSNDSKEFRRAFDQPQGLCAELDEIESGLKNLETVQLVASCFRKFVKKSLIFLSANVLFAIAIFPVIVYYLNFVLRKYRLSAIDNIWSYQKVILILGGICALGLAFARTMKSLNNKGG